jgi:hypothetical protein
MKKNISLFSFVILMIAATLISCSKDSPVINKQEATTLTKITPVNSGRVNPNYVGTISGTLIAAPLKASIMAYNDHYQSEEAVANQDGTFKMNNLPPDGYTLLIKYVPVNGADYLTFEVYKIIVVAGQHTDVGVIVLPE